MTRFLLAIWGISIAFQSLAINIGGSPLLFSTVTELLLIIALIASPSNPAAPAQSSWVRWIQCFGVVAIVSAIVLPFLFAGTPAFVPRLTIDEQVGAMNPVAFGVSNIAQAGYLSLNLMLLGMLSRRLNREDVLIAFHRAAQLGAVLALSTIMLDYLDAPVWSGLLKDALRTNEAGMLFDELSVDGERRIFGMFSEPSYAGVYCAAYSGYFITRAWFNGHSFTDWLYALLLGWAVIITTSSLGTIGLVIAGTALLWSVPASRKAVQIGGFAAVILAMLLIDDPLSYLEFDKLDTLSAINRLASDLRSVELVQETGGLGVGLGSHRASSLLSTLFATTGIIGGSLFLIAVFKATKACLVGGKVQRGQPIFVFLCVAAGCLLAGLAEVSSPLLWIGLVSSSCIVATPPQRKSDSVTAAVPSHH